MTNDVMKKQPAETSLMLTLKELARMEEDRVREAAEAERREREAQMAREREAAARLKREADEAARLEREERARAEALKAATVEAARAAAEVRARAEVEAMRRAADVERRTAERMVEETSVKAAHAVLRRRARMGAAAAILGVAGMVGAYFGAIKPAQDARLAGETAELARRDQEIDALQGKLRADDQRMSSLDGRLQTLSERNAALEKTVDELSHAPNKTPRAPNNNVVVHEEQQQQQQHKDVCPLPGFTRCAPGSHDSMCMDCPN